MLLCTDVHISYPHLPPLGDVCHAPHRCPEASFDPSDLDQGCARAKPWRLQQG